MISFYFPLCSFSKALLEWLKCLSPLRLTTLQITEKSSPFTFIENLWCVSQVLCHISSNIRFIIVWCTAEKEKIWPTTLWCVLLWYMYWLKELFYAYSHLFFIISFWLINQRESRGEISYPSGDYLSFAAKGTTLPGVTHHPPGEAWESSRFCSMRCH